MLIIMIYFKPNDDSVLLVDSSLNKIIINYKIITANNLFTV